MVLFHSCLRSLSVVVYLEAMHIELYCMYHLIPFGNSKESKHYYKQKSNGYGERIIKEDMKKNCMPSSSLFVSLTQNFLPHGEHYML